ncbi:GIY-YIG nuclease family protein [Winogradskyella sp.]
MGLTQDLEHRTSQHNNTKVSKFTKRAKDWRLVYSESFEIRAEAQKREYAIKRKKSRAHIEWLINMK